MAAELSFMPPPDNVAMPPTGHAKQTVPITRLYLGILSRPAAKLRVVPGSSHLAKRERLHAAPNQFGVDIRTAAFQFSAVPDVAISLIAGAHTEAQALANASSMKATIPQAFWAELKRQDLIEQSAPVPEGRA